MHDPDGLVELRHDDEEAMATAIAEGVEDAETAADPLRTHHQEEERDDDGDCEEAEQDCVLGRRLAILALSELGRRDLHDAHQTELRVDVHDRALRRGEPVLADQGGGSAAT